jgi:hypothetical protein
MVDDPELQAKLVKYTKNKQFRFYTCLTDIECDLVITDQDVRCLKSGTYLLTKHKKQDHILVSKLLPIGYYMYMIN